MNYRRIAKFSAIALACGAISLTAVVGVEIIMALHAPPLAPFTNPDHAACHFGKSGDKLTYVVMGDSTGAGQGAPYEDGIAVQSAQHLADTYKVSVSMINLSVSGAVTNDLLRDQMPEVTKLRPDLVLLMIGSNDVTHRTPSSDLSSQLSEVLNQFAAMPKPPKVIVSGAGDLGACPRFAQPLRWIVGLQTKKVNQLMGGVAIAHGTIWADIGAKTGPFFRRDPTLFSEDGFHPNARGYAVWTRFIDEAIDAAQSPLEHITKPLFSSFLPASER